MVDIGRAAWVGLADWEGFEILPRLAFPAPPVPDMAVGVEPAVLGHPGYNNYLAYHTLRWINVFIYMFHKG